jgi:hypothetical protein
MWTRHLQAAVVLKDGRRLETVHDAVDLISSLPRNRQTAEYWDLALDALTTAERGRATRFDLAAAQRRLTNALKTDGML